MKTQKHWTRLVIILVIVMMFSSCLNTKNQKSQIVGSIDGEKISLAEVTIYLLRVKEEFEKVAGVEVWDIEDFSGGKTAEQVAKEGALENLIRDKILDKKAASLNVALEESIINETTKKAEEYYEEIPQEIIEKNNITKQTVIDSFMAFRLASEVTNVVNNSYEPSEKQISEEILKNEDYVKLKKSTTEDILTLYVLKRILINTSNLSGDEQNQAYEKALNIYNKAQAGEDFDKLIEEYSEEEYSEEGYKISATLLDENLKEPLEKLSVGEISEVLKTEQGYNIFKIIGIEKPNLKDVEDYEKEFKLWEKKLEEEAIIKLKQEAFNEIYGEWKKESNININNEVWEKVSIFND